MYLIAIIAVKIKVIRVYLRLLYSNLNPAVVILFYFRNAFSI